MGHVGCHLLKRGKKEAKNGALNKSHKAGGKGCFFFFLRNMWESKK